ncbi:MAG TPA: c-type cytochrome [Gemmatimonadales bacterium]|nr:c-type cytochrome [Gemmatimonadales bacterium]
MPSTGQVIALVAATMIAVAGCKPQTSTPAQGTGAGPKAEDRIAAGGAVPAANALSAPRPATPNPDAGGTLFAAMNCDGCHGGGAVGWVGPSLVDGRWRYGGADDEIFTSIFYGRPKGMPAYGGVIGTDGAWQLVAYIKAQAVPTVVPTTSWLAGGNATATPAAAHEGEQAPGAATPAPAAPAANAPETEVPPDQLPAKYGCTACHAVDHKVVGPAFKDVAAKYRGKDVGAVLSGKIKNGGSGVWGEIPMPPNPQVPDPDLQAIVKWILSLK